MMNSMLCLGLVAGIMGAMESPMVWPCDSMVKVLQSDLPSDNTPSVLSLSGARGETVSGQAVVRLDQDAAEVTASITALQSEQNAPEITADKVSLQWVRYIAVERNSNALPEEEMIAKAPVSLPDPFWEDPTIAVPTGQSQPLWIEVSIPSEALAGDYRATLQVTAAGKTFDLPVALHVWDFDMPQERHLSVINWWNFPGTGFTHIEPFTEPYWELLASACRFVVAHRQTAVWASLTQLVDETGDETIGYQHDTSRFVKWVEIAFAAGIDQVHLQSMASTTAPLTEPESAVAPIKDEMLRRLAAADRVCAERGWQGRLCVSVTDEPFVHHEDSFRDAVAQIHAAAPGMRVIEAVESIHLGLDIYVPKLNHLHLWYPEFDRIRKETNAELWYYTCCIPSGRYPNRFLDQSLVKARLLHWINYRYQLDGFLHWGFNHFDGDDPYTEDGISKGLPLGDRAIAYPGKQGFIGSLRYSAQRDGLQDYEYLWLLEQRIRELKDRVGDDAHWLNPTQRPMELCSRVADTFIEYTRDHQVLADTRQAIAEEIEAIHNDHFLFVQTTPQEGFPVPPAAPTNTIVRGIVTPGAEVFINGEKVANVKPSGAFSAYLFNVGENVQTIEILARGDGWEQTVIRTFPKYISKSNVLEE